MIEVKILPPKDTAVVDVLHDDIFPLESMNHISLLEADHMHDSIYLHALLMYKMNNIGWLDLTLYFACSYTLLVDVHRFDICDTMVHCFKLVGSAPQIVDNSRR